MQKNIQAELFDFIQNKLPPDQKMAAWVCEVLDMDSSSAYRRIRGTTELAFNEYLKLLEQFPQLQQFVTQKAGLNNMFSGSLRHFNDWDTLGDYYEQMLDTLEKAASKKHHLNYVARDLPFFSFFGDKELMRYKLTVWAKCGGMKTSSNPPEKLLDMGTRLFEVYQRLNTVEVWYVWGIYNQISQLLYWHELDYITEKEVSVISDGFCRVMEQYELWLEKQVKPGGGEITIYTSDFCVMNNGGLLQVGQNRSTLMNGFQGIHYLTTTNNEAIELFNDHWEAQIDLSASITGSNVKARYNFFKNIKNRISEAVPQD